MVGLVVSLYVGFSIWGEEFEDGIDFAILRKETRMLGWNFFGLLFYLFFSPIFMVVEMGKDGP